MDTFRAERLVRGDLQSEEKLLWVGQPRQGLRFTASDLLALPFAVFWCGFVAVWEWIAIRQQAGLIFVLWGVPFALVGLHMLVGRFFTDARRRSRTFYGLTSRRVLIIVHGSRKNVESYGLDALPQVTFSEGSNRRGTILLWGGPLANALFAVAGGARNRRSVLPRLDDIEDARSVYDRLIRAQEELKRVPVS